LNGLTDAGAQALAPHNIRVNALAMGPTDTEMLRALFKPGGKLAHLGGPDGPPPEIAATFMDPAEIARLLIDLLKDGRTGENIGVWAGFSIELGPRKRWDVRMRERADFTGQPCATSARRLDRRARTGRTLGRGEAAEHLKVLHVSVS